MIFGFGGHPGFNVPLEKGKHFEDYRLRFAQPVFHAVVYHLTIKILGGLDILLADAAEIDPEPRQKLGFIHGRHPPF